MFVESIIGQRLARGDFSPFHLIGDSGYACTPYLLTPYAAPINDPQQRFNVAHKKSRCVIERFFGMVKRRFPALFFGIRMQPGRAYRSRDTGMLYPSQYSPITKTTRFRRRYSSKSI
jgi:hypothetical protein